MESWHFPPALTQATEVTMAQANYLTNPIRAPITDAHPKASTNPYIQSFVHALHEGGVS